MSEAARELLLALASGRSVEDIAQQQGASDQAASVEKIIAFIDHEFTAKGLAWRAGGAPLPPARQVAIAGRLTFGFHCLPARATQALAAKLIFVFRAPTFAWMLLGCAIVAAFAVLLFSPLPSRLSPGGIGLPLFAWGITILAHELGHAAALMRFGQMPGPIGFGVTGVMPALYVDLSAAWSLKRGQRTLVDAGGIVVQVLSWIPLRLLLRTLGDESIVSSFDHLVALSIMWSLCPLFKLDGYWIIADSLGVTNLTQHLIRTLRDNFSRPGLFGPRTTARKLSLLSVIVAYTVSSIALTFALIYSALSHLVQEWPRNGSFTAFVPARKVFAVWSSAEPVNMLAWSDALGELIFLAISALILYCAIVRLPRNSRNWASTGRSIARALK